MENNEPPHIHVDKGGGFAKWWLTPEPVLVYSTGFKVGDERKIKKLINEHQHDLIQAWERYFSR